MNRFQQAIPSGFIALIGIIVAYISYTQTPAKAFIFPQIISTAFVLLSLWNFIFTLWAKKKSNTGITCSSLLHILPGLIVSFLYVSWAIPFLGFYPSTAITFLILLTLYDPASHIRAKTWGKRILITLCFMTIIYLLFALILRVYTP